MRIAIMQPSYIPYIGYFDLILRSDMFVFLDDVQYTKNDWRNRNKIKTSNGDCWLTIPVKRDAKLISDVVTTDESFKEKHLKTIGMNYKKAPYFYSVYKMLQKSICPYGRLYSSWILIVQDIMSYLGIPFDFYYSSSFKVDESKTDRLIKLCKYLNADEYLSPNGAEPYLEPEKFEKAGIKLIWQNYKHPEYNQLWGDFIPNMSIIDLLFNHGRDSERFISTG